MTEMKAIEVFVKELFIDSIGNTIESIQNTGWIIAQ